MASTTFDHEWTLEEARTVVADLWEPLKAIGYYVGMTGSVLVKGKSTKDLDLIIYPANKGKQDRGLLLTTLTDLGLRCRIPYGKVLLSWGANSDTKHVEIWTSNDRRIDIFFLQ